MVRLYRSPSPGKRRFIENQSDIVATRSPICGAAVLGKIISSNKPSTNSNVPQADPSTGNRGQPEYVSIHPHSKKSIFSSAGGLSYESIGNSPTHSGGRKSPESTESSTSGASSNGEEELQGNPVAKKSSSYALQFEPELQETTNEEDCSDENDRLQLRMDRLQAWMEQQKKTGSNAHSQQGSSSMSQNQGFSIRSRAHLWSTNLPVVTEERSFEAEDSSIASAGQSLKDDGEVPKNIRSYSSPERNEMLLAMRQLVLKQQAALSEMAEENKHYRGELQECRKLLQLAKEAYTKQQRQVEAFMVEKESADAEVLWLREEVKTLRGEIQKQQEMKKTWTSSKTSDEVEERLRKVRAETPERRKTQHTQTLSEASCAPSPISSPAQSPVSSPTRDWKLKSILPEMNYLTDETESDDELMREFHDLRTSLEGAGISAKEMEKQLLNHKMAEASESRDDSRLSPNMWQDEDSRGPEEEIREWAGSRSPDQTRKEQENTKPHGPDDEMHEWARTRSPVQTRKRQDETEAPGPEDEMREWDRSRSPVQQSQEKIRGRSRQRATSIVPRESSRTPSEFSAAGSSVSVASSAASQRSREEVALFKTRLDAIQKKREYRKQIEENVGSRSGRVRFT